MSNPHAEIISDLDDFELAGAIHTGESLKREGRPVNAWSRLHDANLALLKRENDKRKARHANAQ